MTPKEIRKKINGIISSCAGLPPMDQPTMNGFYYDAAIKAAEMVDCPQLKAEDVQNIVSGQTDYLAPLDLLEFVDVQFLNNVNEYETLKNVELSLLRQYRNVDDFAVYAHAGMIRTAGADYGKRILRLAQAPTSNVTDGLVISYKLKPTKLEEVPDTQDIQDFPDSVQAAIPYQVAFYWFSMQGAKPIKDLGANYGQYFADQCRAVQARLGDQQQKDVRRQITTDWGGIVL